MPKDSNSNTPWRVFYSYSHHDEAARDRLSTYLAPFRQNGRIEEWYDRKILPGTEWDNEIAVELESAHLIILLVSENFLASQYCYSVEIDRALARLKLGEVKVVPVLLKPCQWHVSRFSHLQMVPRDAKPILTSPFPDSSFNEVASEIVALLGDRPPVPKASPELGVSQLALDQLQSLARQYEMTRQRMDPSHARTARMEQTLSKLVAIAAATHPLLAGLSLSPSPGERLAAVAILQVFASDAYLDFLLGVVRTEKPFLQYQSIRSLQFAVGGLDARHYPRLMNVLLDAKASLDAEGVAPGTDRQRTLHAAIRDLEMRIAELSPPTDEAEQ